MTKRTMTWLATSAVGALSMIAAPAVAQTAAPADHGAALEEVIVTANRRESRLQDVPAAISAVTSNQLERSRIVDLGSLASSVPSFSMTEGSGLAKELSIRGVTSVRIVDASAEPSVGVFVDEIYISRNGSAFTDFFDLDRIEVIRGPQGVLLGKNVVGGAISVITAKPKFDNQGSATVSLGNYDAIKTSGFVTGPLTDTLAARVAFQTRSRSGYGRNIVLKSDVDDLKSYQVRAELLYRAEGADLQALLTADYGSSENNGAPARDLTDDPFTAGLGVLSVYRATNNIGPRDSTSPQHEYVRSIGRGASLRIDWGAFAGAKLTAITGYRNSKGDVGYNQLGIGSPPGLVDTYYAYAERPKTWSQEVRLVSDLPESRLDWIVGAYHQEDHVTRFDSNKATTNTAIAALDGTFLYANKAHLKTSAIFGQVGFKLTEQLKVTAGVRYTKDDKDGRRTATCLEDRGSGLPDGVCVAALALAGGQSFTVDYGQKWDAVTPQAIVEYRPNEQIMLYASAAKGFKGGGWDHLPATAAAARISYDPEKVTNYEVGVKSDFLDRRLRLNVSAFNMDYKDLQVQQLVVECLCTVTSNAGTAKIKGVEGETIFAVTDGLQLFASASLLDAKYDKFIDSSGANFSGNRIPRSPKYKYDIGASYEFSLGDWDRAFSLRTNYTREGKIFWTPQNTISRDSYGTWDASLRVAPPKAPWVVSVWGKNLSNTRYSVASQTFFGDLMNYYAPPRTYGVDLTYAF
ncbi:MAG: TonB-dependent receptor [Alphaproteobacteria bacterium]|nr:TonB-dependent receptor [Alphaproteobacteria bacterium]MBU1512505.1 TonB-dependent receptor [Alphaproteobacteria bacterium]MBU2096571.1 TonB-dependent receptor [Alphaproteobacteria bacterium]MBU2151611.1 TonB-dependent receptor [Alphaproteobacteria bacterium]MBU2307329.1 TonB-dependent receptor [Alphaproteobacteria bacterium]